MLLLDDDIRRLSIEKLSAAAALLDKYPVVGLQVNKYPDASVVGHARRLTGRRQEPFISGGALLVDPQRLNGFFPAIYHEDWLCVINHLRAGEVAVGGMVGQLPYKPFAIPERAKNEEFGDIFTSSLLGLIHARKKKSTIDSAEISDADYWREAMEPGFWEQILEQRAALLDGVAKRFTAQYPNDLLGQQSIYVARRRCAELTPDEFVSVAKKWLSNLEVWRERISNLPEVDSVEKALAELGISRIVHSYRPGSGQTQPDSDWQPQTKGLTTRSAFIFGGLIGAVTAVLYRRLRRQANK